MRRELACIASPVGCPICGFDFSHFGFATPPPEESQVSWGDGSVNAFFSRDRGDKVIEIPFVCEDGHQLTLRIVEHEGLIGIHVDEGDGRRGPPPPNFADLFPNGFEAVV
jgi:hypothetical protein